MAENHSDAIEWMRRLRDMWIADIETLLSAISPALLSGQVPVGILPPGTVVSRGAYNADGRYRVGDVIASGGALYMAIAAGSGNDPTNTAFWQPFGLGGTLDGLSDVTLTSPVAGDLLMLFSDGQWRNVHGLPAAESGALYVGGVYLTIGGDTLTVGG